MESNELYKEFVGKINALAKEAEQAELLELSANLVTVAAYAVLGKAGSEIYLEKASIPAMKALKLSTELADGFLAYMKSKEN